MTVPCSNGQPHPNFCDHRTGDVNWKNKKKVTHERTSEQPKLIGCRAWDNWQASGWMWSDSLPELARGGSWNGPIFCMGAFQKASTLVFGPVHPLTATWLQQFGEVRGPSNHCRPSYSYVCFSAGITLEFGLPPIEGKKHHIISSQHRMANTHHQDAVAILRKPVEDFASAGERSKVHGLWHWLTCGWKSQSLDAYNPTGYPARATFVIFINSFNFLAYHLWAMLQ